MYISAETGRAPGVRAPRLSPSRHGLQYCYRCSTIIICNNRYTFICTIIIIYLNLFVFILHYNYSLESGSEALPVTPWSGIYSIHSKHSYHTNSNNSYSINSNNSYSSNS